MAEEPKPEAAKEAKPEAAPAAETKEAPKAASPMKDFLPLIIILVLMPVLSFVMNQFVLIPSMKKAIDKTLSSTVDASKEHPKEGHGEKSKGGHGEKGEHGEEGKPSKPSKTFKNIIANLAGTMQSRYIKISFTLEGKSPDFESTMTANESKIIDTTLSILSTLTIVDLDKPGIRNQLRNDLMVAYANVLEKDLITNMYFSEFVVQ